MADLAAVARDLHVVPLPDFVTARNAAAASLKDEGRTELAAVVRGWRKPSAAAWAVNLLAREQPDVLDEVVDLGLELREAQESGDGGRIRELDRVRRNLLRRAVEAATTLAAARDQPLGPAARDGVEESLRSALADGDAARAVRSGVLVAAVSANGFEPVDLEASVAVPDALPPARTLDPGRARRAPGPRAVPTPRPRTAAAVDTARRKLEEKRRAATASARTLRDARAEQTTAAADRRDVEKRPAAARAAVRALESDLAAADEQLAEHARSVADAEKADAAAQRAAQRAQDRLDALR
jgi:hypothetical protein